MGWQQAIPAVISLVSASGKVDSGNAAASYGAQQQAAANYQAAQMRVNAGQAVASSQRVAEEQRRQGALVQSRAIALASSSGGGVTDPGIINLLARNAGEMAYASSVALYEGEDRARTLNENAKATEYSGAQALKAGLDRQKAAMTGAFGDLLKGGGSLYTAFGGGGAGAGIDAASASETAAMSAWIG